MLSFLPNLCLFLFVIVVSLKFISHQMLYYRHCWVKVDFNADVVAFREAQIESTRAGTSSFMITTEQERAMKD